ncbi:polymer-forming cytoskeletal protein [bacterium]|nr:polymer-forming cytoskeletal protein [bacterium]
MKRQGNFMKAVGELMDGQFAGSKAEDEALGDSVPAGPEASGEPASFGFGASPAAMPGAASSLRRVEAGGAEAVITADMVIKGTMTASANISVFGSIQGDVTSEGDILVKGRVEGNVVARCMTVQEGSIVGDIAASGTVVVAENSSVDGNIKAERIEVNGRVKGNLDSSAKIALRPLSDVEGNVTAAELAMGEGAQLRGTMNVHRPAQG